MKVKTTSKTVSRSGSLKTFSSPTPKKSRGRAIKENPSLGFASSLHQTFERKKYPIPGEYLSSSVSGERQSRLGNSLKHNNSIEFRLIFTVAFGLFLLTSVLERALPHKWSNRSDAGEIRKSVVEQAREAAHISVGYAFMG